MNPSKPQPTPEERLREEIFWQLNNLICNSSDKMVEEAINIEATGNINKGGTGDVQYTVQIARHLDDIMSAIKAAYEPIVEAVKREARLDELNDFILQVELDDLTNGTRSYLKRRRTALSPHQNMEGNE